MIWLLFGAKIGQLFISSSGHIDYSHAVVIDNKIPSIREQLWSKFGCDYKSKIYGSVKVCGTGPWIRCFKMFLNMTVPKIAI